MARVALIAQAIILALLALAFALLARGQVPAGTFGLGAVSGLCGPTETHRRLLQQHGFETAWRGSNAIGDRAVLVINAEGFWQLLVTVAGRPAEACIVGSGERLEYSPVGRD
jgi:hypothetical protein